MSQSFPTGKHKRTQEDPPPRERTCMTPGSSTYFPFGRYEKALNADETDPSNSGRTAALIY